MTTPAPAPPAGQHRQVCCYCQATIREGDPALPVSHGSCVPCAERVLADAAARKAVA